MKNKKTYVILSYLIMIMLLFHISWVCSAELLAEPEITSNTSADNTRTLYGTGIDSGRWNNDFYSANFNEAENASINLPAAWLLQTVSSVKVGILDSGILSTHEDFAGNYMGGASFVDS